MRLTVGVHRPQLFDESGRHGRYVTNELLVAVRLAPEHLKGSLLLPFLKVALQCMANPRIHSSAIPGLIVIGSIYPPV